MVYCNECNKEFEIIAKVKKYSKGIEELYFKCPHCKERYSSYFTDSNIRKQQKAIRETKDLEEKRKLQTMLKIDMDNLKRKMLGTQ